MSMSQQASNDIESPDSLITKWLKEAASENELLKNQLKHAENEVNSLRSELHHTNKLLESALANINHDQCAKDLTLVKEDRDKFAVHNERMRNEFIHIMAMLRAIIPGHLVAAFSELDHTT